MFVWKDVFGRRSLLKYGKDFHQLGVKRDFPPSFGATTFLSRFEHYPPFFEIHIIPHYVPAGSDPAHGIFHKKQVRRLFRRGNLQHLEKIRFRRNVFWGVVFWKRRQVFDRVVGDQVVFYPKIEYRIQDFSVFI